MPIDGRQEGALLESASDPAYPDPVPPRLRAWWEQGRALHESTKHLD
jgi:hypothetical protein